MDTEAINNMDKVNLIFYYKYYSHAIKGKYSVMLMFFFYYFLSTNANGQVSPSQIQFPKTIRNIFILGFILVLVV